jgi:hypothetical protein
MCVTVKVEVQREQFCSQSACEVYLFAVKRHNEVTYRNWWYNAKWIAWIPKNDVVLGATKVSGVSGGVRPFSRAVDVNLKCLAFASLSSTGFPSIQIL